MKKKGIQYVTMLGAVGVVLTTAVACGHSSAGMSNKTNHMTSGTANTMNNSMNNSMNNNSM